MHPPLLPNPSGEGLEFYKKKNNEKNPQDVQNSSSHIGMCESHCVCFSWGGFFTRLVERLRMVILVAVITKFQFY